MRTTRAVIATAAFALALAATPAHAAEPVWKVANPAADGKFKAVAPTLTVTSQSGTFTVTCSNVTLSGPMASKSDTSTFVGTAVLQPTDQCTDSAGRPWRLFSPSFSFSQLNAKGYDQATGRTTVEAAVPFFSLASRASDFACSVILQNRPWTYTNATSVLKTTTAESITDSDKCQFPKGSTPTFAADFKVTPAVKITRIPA
ncbi:hypothetical protein [Actinomadura hibisca]|uniref:hypothetical protein n=1 Tax=Actinomadura hibisca TaxID=68565 RepID=UPI000833C831|nr:hypothetical protein [Actinomadura hibisca]